MLCIQKCDMHLFQTEEQKQSVVYQVETGLFFKLDTLFQSILERCEGMSSSQVVQMLADQYEAEEIVCRCHYTFRIRAIFNVLIALPMAGITEVRPC